MRNNSIQIIKAALRASNAVHLRMGLPANPFAALENASVGNYQVAI
jgi:hypothetical protein